ncbi:dimethylaniline monooxygenase [Tricladium varicosporioides]|nr:dimethylaniline monooxygenase [Hymenoscyphus varicosporioides]
MAFPISRVAVIGAGVSGILTAKYLKEEGIEAIVFERGKKAGGNWVYDERVEIEGEWPCILPLKEERVDICGEINILSQISEDPKDIDTISLRFAPPGPAYDGLKNNVSFKMQELKGHPWPEGIEEFENSQVSEEYIQSYSRKFGVEELIRYNTNVDSVEKVGKKWRVEMSMLGREGLRKGMMEEFDAVVVANGHYHTIKVPDIPGLKEWKRAWPGRVQHSKTYRRPDSFRDQNVLLIGGGVSAMDIGRELSTVAKNVHQSTRGGPFDIPIEMLSPLIQRIPEITSFEDPTQQPKPGNVTLKDGRNLTGIDRVILCTGYHHTLPFLSQFHNSYISPKDADDKVLVTDGTQIHNLHKDIFYIPDPTLSFIGLPYYTPTFSFFEYQAIAIAAVFSGKAWLPGEGAVRRVYEEKVAKRGVGRNFHSLKDEDDSYVEEVVGWVNECAKVEGTRCEYWKIIVKADLDLLRTFVSFCMNEPDSQNPRLVNLHFFAPVRRLERKL